jgi:hypothetical protein
MGLIELQAWKMWTALVWWSCRSVPKGFMLQRIDLYGFGRNKTRTERGK